MNHTDSFVRRLEDAIGTSPDIDNDQLFVALLEEEGFTYAARSATNLRLLQHVFPDSLVCRIAVASLATPLPDMALNGLERVSGVADRDEILAVCSQRDGLSQLLTICGSSPFLVNILCRDPSYFHHLFIRKAMAIRRSEAEMLAELRSQVPKDTDYTTLFPLLRRFKFMEILRIAARDLTGVAPLEEVTGELSSLAAAALQVAQDVARKKLVAEHGLPLMETPDGLREAELTILGMGKFGGRELNFSSDIDLIYFYSSDQGETAGIPDGKGGTTGRITLHAFFVKLGEMISKAVSQVTADGFVFRVDLGLRPEGKSGDMACSFRSAATYYEYWGQSWERAAMLKARPVAGSIELGNRILAAIEPFIYRKYLDYNLIEDMMAMKKKIDASLARQQEGELNIKLGRGGIREIEFFIQALQLVYAGKNPALRERNSLKALETLKDGRIIAEEDAAALADAYRFLRTVEHRIQVVQERQTHSLPKKDDEMLALARRCGYLRKDGLAKFREVLEGHRERVSAIYGGLFLSRDEKLKEEVRPETYYFFDRGADPDFIKDMLAERRFENVDAAYENLLLLRDGPPRAHLTERSRRLLEQISPLLLQEIFASPDPDMALTNLERFLCAVGSRSSFYALLAENREILKLLVSFFATSELLSKIFIGHPELLDSLVSRSYASFIKDREAMEGELEGMLAAAADYEERLDILRRYRNEEFLRIGLTDIYGKLGQSELTYQLTGLAEVCLSAACRMAKKELVRFGRPMYRDADGDLRQAHFAVVAMGKMGGNELNYHSDLDIIYIYDEQGETDGEKQISNREYFAKLGQKIISILTTPTREGYVYKIDTRLRPSGNAGPLVTSLESFRTYHGEEAQVWERQALTKARVVFGDERLRRQIEEVIRGAVYGFGADETVRQEIHRLRTRMEVELAREKEGSYNIKTGRGGIVDIEFMVQYLQLCHGVNLPEVRSTNTLLALKAMRLCGVLTEEEFATLQGGYKFLRRLENRLRLIHDYSINDLGGPREYLDKLARRLGYDPKLRHPGDLLMREYEETTEAVRRIYERILGGDSPGGAAA
ncbi:bifunctional [glutamate--ammonia ligase]-adenylyl-L-tyrosine phosphorylase/[glutamate--ammonia-ligase] adenylyltransferase [Geobacter hydrogenophilus]|uniref:Glutamate-ammonia-ligase adenylyltransferase n=1 Tax=Geobacter hydrogenophilus TaxID=40983 RepID=A0A9W6FZP4_9BACT|nr:bifunctional [glutamate--ammonia ligase]-adenylyl-L-tyrosine phosphorylase/[glutamate--ammonia-ligase] adenylyltransferase [Geobacter hydrogenophilus]MBT0893964.1 bifunctional [glutamate--ammonia ligase]-adenylyl-L-tyrosine phosphorylase/[glutamate--ammonia-ligase] adenylyltransferase [Geobacter hydrogenophilus]GLI38089.1 glutamate-ammonia-ligase adenylyltransferase [Geobacter hydrogenophilus]